MALRSNIQHFRLQQDLYNQRADYLEDGSLALHHKITSCQQVFLLRRNKNPGGVVHNFSVLHESERPNLGVRWIHNDMSCGKAFVLHFGGNFSPYHAFVRAELEYYESGAKEIGTTLQIHGNGRDFI